MVYEETMRKQEEIQMKGAEAERDGERWCREGSKRSCTSC